MLIEIRSRLVLRIHLLSSFRIYLIVYEALMLDFLFELSLCPRFVSFFIIVIIIIFRSDVRNSR